MEEKAKITSQDAKVLYAMLAFAVIFILWLSSSQLLIEPYLTQKYVADTFPLNRVITVETDEGPYDLEVTRAEAQCLPPVCYVDVTGDILLTADQPQFRYDQWIYYPESIKDNLPWYMTDIVTGIEYIIYQGD